MGASTQAKIKYDFSNTEVAFSAKSDEELRKMYWLFRVVQNPLVVKIGTYLLIIALKLKLPIKYLIKKTVFSHFCGGETQNECISYIEKLHQHKVTAILDYSAEGEKNKRGFDLNRDEMLSVVDTAVKMGLPYCVVKLTAFAPIEVMERIQSGNATEEDEIIHQRLEGRLQAVAQKCYDNNLRLLVDAEETWIQQVIDALVYKMVRLYNKERAIVFNTYQLYCKAAYQNLVNAHETLSSEGFFLGVKLVRGAYMEKERDRAEELGYEDPIQPNKEATDRDYNKALAYCVENIDRMEICAGSHNEASAQFLADCMTDAGLAKNDPRIFFAQLYGMSDHISFTMAKEGYNVAKYLPYGPVEKVMPYLIRRAEENTSIAGQSGRELRLIKTEFNRRKQAKKQS